METPAGTVRVGNRIEVGFRRLALVLSVPCFAVAALTLLLALANGAKGGDNYFISGMAFALGAALYVGIRAIAWVAVGFFDPPTPAPARAVATTPPLRIEPELPPAQRAVSGPTSLAPPDDPVVGREPVFVPLRDKPPPKGIGGWLLLPALGTLITPFLFMYQLYNLASLVDKPSAWPLSSQLYVFGTLGVQSIAVLFGCFTIFLMSKHRRLYPKFFIGLSLFVLFFNIADNLIAANFFNATPSEEDIKNTGRAIANVIVWVPYMLISKRVKNTFVN